MDISLILGIVAVTLLLVILFKVWGLVNQSLPREKLEKLDRLDTFATLLTDLQRVVSNLQAQLGGDSALQADLKKALQGLMVTTAEMNQLKGERQSDLRELRERLESLRGQVERVSSTLTGRKSGLAGENILREALRHFPPEWVRSPYYDVEFGVVLYDHRVIPIDSKFAATELLERLGQLESDGDKNNCADEIERRVLNRAREVAKYIDPTATTSFAICAVPDSIYTLLRRAHIQSYKDYKVIIIGYSLAVPYLLSLYDLHLKSIGQFDEARLEAFLSSVAQNVGIIRENLENRVKEADVRLNNAYRDCVQAVSSIEGALVALKSSRVQSLVEAK